MEEDENLESKCEGHEMGPDNCKHEWEDYTYVYFPDGDPAEGYICTKCGKIEWPDTFRLWYS